MTSVFVDTSGILALINPEDEHHNDARYVFDVLRTRGAPLVTTSLVLVELYALLGRRMGIGAVRAFRADMAPLMEIVWVDEPPHGAGLDLLLERKKRKLSLVDSVSFLTMRRRGIEEVFAYNPDFDEEGFLPVK
ncbi:MAG TPA: PIN domain-containing protein [Vicinamibacteria bacterium]|nr:PIN domain-containing protein [Vicinamibacteria bacterium]